MRKLWLQSAAGGLAALPIVTVVFVLFWPGILGWSTFEIIAVLLVLLPLIGMVAFALFWKSHSDIVAGIVSICNRKVEAMRDDGKGDYSVRVGGDWYWMDEAVFRQLSVGGLVRIELAPRSRHPFEVGPVGGSE